MILRGGCKLVPVSLAIKKGRNKQNAVEITQFEALLRLGHVSQ